jgi:hypothetical protein
MAFTIEMKTPMVISILNNIEKRCSIFPIEVSEQGLSLNVGSDGRGMAFSLMLDKSMFTEFAFQGDTSEGVCLSASNFKKISAKLAYPVGIESGITSGIKISSSTGRQSYNLRPVEDVIAEKAFEKTDKIRDELQKFKNSDDAIVVRVLVQDLKMGLRNVEVADKHVTMTLAGNTFDLLADSVDIDAEAIVNLVEEVDGEWERTYNINFLTDVLNILSTNDVVELYLFNDTRSLLVYLPLSEEGESFCLVNIAPIEQRRGKEEEEVEIEDDDGIDEN